MRQGVGADKRIGTQFLFPGCGYGGSCFPKDVRELIRTAEDHHCDPAIIRAVDAVNLEQKNSWREIQEFFLVFFNAVFLSETRT